MEKLRTYLSDQNLSQNAFALRVGMVPQKLSLIMARKQRITAEEAVRIEDVTGGAVTVRDLA